MLVLSGGHFEKMATIFFQQHICKVVHLEVVQEGPLNTLIPNNLLQQPMSGKPVLPPGYVYLVAKVMADTPVAKENICLYLQRHVLTIYNM